jgi:hypothetical protein
MKQQQKQETIQDDDGENVLDKEYIHVISKYIYCTNAKHSINYTVY